MASEYPELQIRPSDGWARIPRYWLPEGLWTTSEAEVAFRFPARLPGEAPYAFWVRMPFALRDSGHVHNAEHTTTPFGGEWLQFSWAPSSWPLGATADSGSSMVTFVRSFADRLTEGA